MSDEIKWEDPPPINGGKHSTKWALLLAPLRDRPGEWANIGKQATGMRTNIVKGHVGGAEAGEFECTTRASDDPKRPTHFVRYVGKPNLKSAAS